MCSTHSFGALSDKLQCKQSWKCQKNHWIRSMSPNFRLLEYFGCYSVHRLPTLDSPPDTTAVSLLFKRCSYQKGSRGSSQPQLYKGISTARVSAADLFCMTSPSQQTASLRPLDRWSRQWREFHCKHWKTVSSLSSISEHTFIFCMPPRKQRKFRKQG